MERKKELKLFLPEPLDILCEDDDSDDLDDDFYFDIIIRCHQNIKKMKIIKSAK